MKTELLENMVEAAKKSKKGFRTLKEAVVSLQQYELGAELRSIEKDLFPETEEVKQAKETGSRMNLLFRMLDLNVSNEIAWMIFDAIRQHGEKGSNFTLSDACDLIEKRKRIFEE